MTCRNLAVPRLSVSTKPRCTTVLPSIPTKLRCAAGCAACALNRAASAAVTMVSDAPVSSTIVAVVSSMPMRTTGCNPTICTASVSNRAGKPHSATDGAAGVRGWTWPCA